MWSEVAADGPPYHGHAQSLTVDLPPLGVVVYVAKPRAELPVAAVVVEAAAETEVAIDAPPGDTRPESTSPRG